MFQSEKLRSNEKILVTAAVLASALLRSLLARYEIYHPDSGLYLMLARAVSEGHLYINIGSETGLYQPMFSIITSVLSIIFRNLEVAGTVVSILAGSLLTGVVYLLARRLDGMRAGIIAAAIAMFYPLLVKFSTLVLTEMLYTLFFGLTVLVGWVAIEKRCKYLHLAAGGFLGLGYLTRMVGITNLPLMLAWSLWMLRKDGKSNLFACASFLVVAVLLVTSPYFFYLKKMTGSLRLTGQQGLAYYNVVYEDQYKELSGKLSEDGTHFKTAELTQGLGLMDAIKSNPGYFVRNFTKNVKKLIVIDLRELLSPVLMAAILLGVFFGIRNKPEHADEVGQKPSRRIFTIYLMSFCLPVLGLHLNTGTSYRYYIPLLAVLIPVAGFGVNAIVDVVASSIIKKDIYRTAIAAVLVCLTFIPYLPWKQDPDSLWVKPQRSAGMWIKEHSKWPMPRVMTREPYVAYFSGGEQVTVPGEALDRVLNYVRAQRVNYIVADSLLIEVFFPELYALIQGPVPNGLKPMYRVVEGGRIIIVYEVVET